jgi:hypothetical protein
MTEQEKLDMAQYTELLFCFIKGIRTANNLVELYNESHLIKIPENLIASERLFTKWFTRVIFSAAFKGVRDASHAGDAPTDINKLWQELSK